MNYNFFESVAKNLHAITGAAFKIVVLLLLVSLGIAFTIGVLGIPFALVWSLNTLFSTGIEYNIWTWLASLALISLLRVCTISEKQ